MKETALTVSGMDCASCVAHVEKAVARLPGVQQCQVNLARGRAVVQFDPKQLDEQKIATAITEEGYPATVESDASAHQHEDHAPAWLIRAIAGIILWFPVELAHWIIYVRHPGHHHGMTLDWIAFITSTIAIVFVGGAFFRSAWGALKRRTSNMDTLISLGAGVAYLYSLVAFVGILRGAWEPVNLYFMESTGLLALISLGHYLEARARTAAGDAIHQLLNLAPATALKLTSPPDSSSLNPEPRTLNPVEVPVSTLNINDRILIRPGNRVPIDSIILEGQSSIDESMLTGEPLPVRRTVGDEIIGGTINHDGALTARVTKVGSETALAQIIRMVEQAQASKPPVQKLADKIAAIFVPSVLVIALITGIAWYLVGALNHWPQPIIWGRLANAVCSVLVIACPCALGLAIPAALMVGTGRGARKGILIRDISALQAAEKIDTIILDKTGTITRGKPTVSRVIKFNSAANLDTDDLLTLAASIEQLSEHPLARAIVDSARQRNSQFEKITDFKNEPGLGVTGKLADSTLLVGSAELLRQHNITPPDVNEPGSIVYIARGQQPLGAILISDEIKPDSARAIADLHKMRLRTVLLTGDNHTNASAIATAVGIEDVKANVRPGGKADVVAQFQSQSSALSPQSSKVAMVGDGINDAPALAAADLGIAIGTGSDIAKESGDIVLVSGSLAGVPSAIRLSKATMRIIRQNLFFAFIYNVLAIPLAACGLLSPLIAAGAMALSDITVLGNSLRLRYIKLSK